MAYVAQSAAAAFNPAHRLIDQIVETPLSTASWPARRPKRDAVELFGGCGLPNPEALRQRYPHQVSGGQLQRAMTAMACRAGPTSSSSTSRRRRWTSPPRSRCWPRSRSIAQIQPAALYITHDLAVVAQMADASWCCATANGRGGDDQRDAEQRRSEDYTKTLWAMRKSARRRRRPAATAPAGRTSTPAMAGVKVLRMSRSTCRGAARSRSSANRAPANRRWRGSSPGCCRRPRATSISTASPCRARSADRNKEAAPHRR